MPCRYSTCHDPDDNMVVCSSDGSHTAHLTCWARWSAAQNFVGYEEMCPVDSDGCFGSATRQGETEEATKTLIVEKMRELGLSARVLPAEEEDGGFAAEFNFDDAPEQQEQGGLEPGIAPQALAGQPAQALAQLVTACTICTADLQLNEAGDDYAPGAAWWCSGTAADRGVLYCTTCKDAQGACPTCVTYALVQASIAIPPTALVYQFAFGYEIDGCRGTGKAQTGMLCYAAATATAILWGPRRDLSIYECMHNYIMSDQSADDQYCAAYRAAYATATSVAPYSTMSVSQVIDSVFRVYDDYIQIFNNVQASFGSPVFPGDIQSQLYSPSMTNEELRAAVMGNRPVIKGEGVHWTVIFGIRGANQDNIARVVVYDPMSNAYRDEVWSPQVVADYFVVG
jgi:hypothetical protein